MKEKIVDLMVRSRRYLLTCGWLGVIGLGIWMAVKLILCTFFGVCII